ncbi:T9SS type A sorting domain-containing protein [Flavobacterium sp. 83]|uniref:DUF7619 domain-containing protein n=1 Tax=Flavobacterium sp. 83 TaxID=1131812 RepID=UPI000557C349|nr:T9SS type A sorting domain-containing protein [Flavobacterium sp. 83]
MKKIYFLLIGILFFNGMNAQVINFTDANFKARLLSSNVNNDIAKDLSGNKIKIDVNNNGEIEVSEALNIYELNINKPNFDYTYILNLIGINDFLNLKVLYCQYNRINDLNFITLKNLKYINCSNNLLTNLNLSSLLNLEHLDCTFNNLNSIQLTGFNGLVFLSCGNNQLTNINLSSLTKLKELFCNSNQISSIDLSKNILLTELGLDSNILLSLNISNLINLERLTCANNKLGELNFAGLGKLVQIEAYNNLLTSIDLNHIGENWVNDFDGLLDFRNNNFSTIYMKNGLKENYIMILDGNPNLQYICCDENEISTIETQIGYLGYKNCAVNSYCSFNPGGNFFAIRGKSVLDSNNNGCDVSDIIFPNLNFSISDGTLKGNVISNISGNYYIPVQEGTYTITPILENPTYFNVSPSLINITFPLQASPFTQDFCITPKGNHQDVAVTIIPRIPARPGFDATYKIAFKNKGNTTLSGNVSLTFNDAVLDFVSAVPLINNQILDKLTWDYVNLQPFETREITVTLNVNSPMETPAVNIGDRLSFNALINPVTGDEKPVDNSSALRQSVVGSFDPNDKTCLEGDVITPSLIGEYVNYLIRFENTGTYAAQNIVVKDLIDLSKFDISTLVPTKASHDFVTKISGNKVEFIFENINLPFDNATNDGYIAFKIKTLPTLVVGDSFANEANIYFDYNFPILTNKATSTFKTLGTPDFEFADYFSVYPNPVIDILNIGTKNAIEVKSMAIYDVLGQLIIAVPNAQTVSKIDVSKLTIGNYFLKMNTNKGTSSVKFIKQ